MKYYICLFFSIFPFLLAFGPRIIIGSGCGNPALDALLTMSVLLCPIFALVPQYWASKESNKEGLANLITILGLLTFVAIGAFVLLFSPFGACSSMGSVGEVFLL